MSGRPKPRRQRTIASTVELVNQVGGHAGVQTTEDGSLLIKPTLPLEHEFYAALAREPDLEPLRPHVPKFLGTLKLHGSETSTEAGVEKESLVLENLSHTFKKPNILDVKLGTILYDEDAAPEKRERMKKTARETTSSETGIRLTGFQVYDNITGTAVVTPKSYGKSIKPAELPDGLRRMFPVASAEPLADGRANLGLPSRTLLPILEAIRDITEEIMDVLSGIELRMVGASLLVVYEADHSRAEEGVRWVEEQMKLVEKGALYEDEEGGDEKDDEHEKNTPFAPFSVKLIDFAHTRLKPGEGPDDGVLLGIETLLRLLEGRIKEVSALVEDKTSE
ncbi:hypothetical protein K488DRAFT_44224 [Vararia minispora EC-137]|uniref:Uncharacterized protein n=1 Tax=Vararia minispora EC-137 TaxID=1314806 RepID=A0ACB8QTI0_9AGAM|nr:hypothetical protein K488DRAFT_44224 [Vararia minispora EC-137]